MFYRGISQCQGPYEVIKLPTIGRKSLETSLRPGQPSENHNTTGLYRICTERRVQSKGKQFVWDSKQVGQTYFYKIEESDQVKPGSASG